MSNRPKSSMFFQVVKSLVTGDKSLQRITNDPGGKNFSTIYSYIASCAYREMMLKPNTKGKIGKDIFLNDEWISPREFLKKMEWVHENGEPTKYTVNMTTNLLNSFEQDKSFVRKELGGTFVFKFKKELEFPSDKEIDEARQSNKLFMMSIDDLIQYIPKTLENGYPTASRNASEMQPLWEAIHNDPLTKAFRDEYVRNIAKNLPDAIEERDIIILEFGIFTGLAVNSTINNLVEKYSNVTINYILVEEVKPLMVRAKQKIQYHLNSINHKLAEKNIVFKMQYLNQGFDSIIDIPDNYADLIAAFQVFHYIDDNKREVFIRNIKNKLNKNGVFCLGQATSYKLEFPYPFTMIYSATENFKGYPISEELRLISEPYFNSVKAKALDSIWTMKKPLKE